MPFWSGDEKILRIFNLTQIGTNQIVLPKGHRVGNLYIKYTHRVWSIKNETNVLHDCANANQKTTNLIKSANCWHLSHSKMVRNLHVGPFLWILEQIVSKKKILKIPRFFQKRKLSKWNQEKMIKMHWNLFQNCIFPKDQIK